MLGSGLAVPIATPPAVLESAIWPTCVSGASPANHGMFATVKIKVGTYDMEDAMYADRLPHLPFWAHLSRGGKREIRTQDIAPTILEFFGVQSPPSNEGKSVLPLLGEAYVLGA